MPSGPTDVEPWRVTTSLADCLVVLAVRQHPQLNRLQQKLSKLEKCKEHTLC